MKNSIAILLLLALTTGGLFAQEGEGRKANVITVDVGPTIIGLGLGIGLGAALPGASGGGFGIGAQYERHITEQFSAAGRFAYLGAKVDMGMSGGSVGIELNSFSIEGHGRWYPFSGAFFLDGMLGYANFAMKMSGSVSGQGLSADTDMGFFKLGGKLGWKIDFGKPGGFVFEPAFGYSGGIKLGGKPFDITGLEEFEDIEEVSNAMSSLSGSIDQAADLLTNFIFVGGPRMTLSFGWAF